MVYYIDGIHQGADMRLFRFFAGKRGSAALSARICLSRSVGLRQDGELTSYCQAVNYLLTMYAADYTIAEVDV